MKNILKIGLVSSVILFTGCVYFDNTEKDENNMDKDIASKINKEAKVDEIQIPDIDKGQTYSYKNSDLKSPFLTVNITSKKSDIYPDFKREKDPLENYGIGEIAMKGTVGVKNNPKQALLLTNDGKIYKAKIGGYMGKNYGKVTSITEKTTTLRELFKDNEGVWFIKMTTMDKK
jgi:Tfp pilus assembly protein PilP